MPHQPVAPVRIALSIVVGVSIPSALSFPLSRVLPAVAGWVVGGVMAFVLTIAVLTVTEPRN